MIYSTISIGLLIGLRLERPIKSPGCFQFWILKTSFRKLLKERSKLQCEMNIFILTETLTLNWSSLWRAERSTSSTFIISISFPFHSLFIIYSFELSLFWKEIFFVVLFYYSVANVLQLNDGGNFHFSLPSSLCSETNELIIQPNCCAQRLIKLTRNELHRREVFAQMNKWWGKQQLLW